MHEQEADRLVEVVLNADKNQHEVEQVKKRLVDCILFLKFILRPFKVDTDSMCPEVEDIPDLIVSFSICKYFIL